jgi:hypothetical protein
MSVMPSPSLSKPLHRGLRACLKGGSESNAEVLAFFEALLGISSDDRNNDN